MTGNHGEVPTPLQRGGPNSIAVANGIVGDEWTLWIVEMALQQGFTQYNQWLQAGPISSSVLTARLGRLVDFEIFERRPYNDRPPRTEYHVTARGRQLWPILITMWSWEQHWTEAGPAQLLPRMRHSECGKLFDPQLICRACGEPTQMRDVRARLGPSGAWLRSIPSSSTRRRSHSGTRPVELLEETMAIFGNRWSVAMLGAAFMGARRFGEFEERMGAPPTIVAERLRTFCEIGVLRATPNPERSDWSVYGLTEKGRAFFPMTSFVLTWGERWFRAPEGPAVIMTHRCGAKFDPRLACSQCGGELRGHTVQVVRLGEEEASARGTTTRTKRRTGVGTGARKASAR